MFGKLLPYDQQGKEDCKHEIKMYVRRIAKELIMLKYKLYSTSTLLIIQL